MVVDMAKTIEGHTTHIPAMQAMLKLSNLKYRVFLDSSNQPELNRQGTPLKCKINQNDKAQKIEEKLMKMVSVLALPHQVLVIAVIYMVRAVSKMGSK